MKLSNFNKGQIQGTLLLSAGYLFSAGETAIGILVAILSILLLIDYIKNKDKLLNDGFIKAIDEMGGGIVERDRIEVREEMAG